MSRLNGADNGGCHDMIKLRKVVEAGGGAGVLGPQRFSGDLEGLLVERFGLFVRAHLEVESRQIVETRGGVGVGEAPAPLG
jgi:hypothetical protein